MKASKIQKRSRKQRIPRNPASPTYSFARTVSQPMILDQAGGFAGVSNTLQMQFSLVAITFYTGAGPLVTPSVPSSTEFTTLFDQWRLDYVDIEVFFSGNSQNVTTAGSTLPLLWYADDYDDANNTTLSMIQQYPRVKIASLGENGGYVLRHRVSPKASLIISDGAGAYGNSPQLNGPTWIDSANPGTPHYGLKFCLDTFGRTAAGDLGSINVVSKMHFSFKNVR